MVAVAGAGSPNRLLWAAAGLVSAPSAPVQVTAVAGRRSATVSWVQGSSGGSPLTGQTVRVYVKGALVGSAAAAGTATSLQVGGLKAGVSHAFTVSAANAVGVSPESTLSAPVVPTR